MKNEPLYSTVADIVRSGRKLKGYTQQELASILRITQGYLSKIESGLLDPNFSLILNYCQVTGINIDSFNHGFISRPNGRTEAPPQGAQTKRAFRPSSKEHITDQGLKVRFLIPIIRFAVARLGRRKLEQICKSLKVDPDILLCHDLEVNMAFVFALASLVQREMGVSPSMEELFAFSRTEMRQHCRSILGDEFQPGTHSLDCVRKFVSLQGSFFSGIRFQIVEEQPNSMEIALTFVLPETERREFEKSEELRNFFERYTTGFFEFMGSEDDQDESHYIVEKVSGFSEGMYRFRITLRDLN